MTSPDAAFSFDESGNTATDYTGNGYDFSIASTSVARTASGHTNGGVTLGATPAELNTALGKTNNRTVMAWLKGTPSTTGWGIIWNVTSISSGCWGILWLTDRVVIQARSATVGPIRASQSTAWDGTAWHHVAGTFDGSTVRLYVDGVLDASASLTGPIRTDNDKLEFGLTVAGWTADDVRVYPAALDQGAIQTARDTPVTATTFTDSGTATLSLAASGAAAVERTASGTAMIGLSASGTSTAERTQAGTASVLLAASGSGTRETALSGTGALVLGGDGTAVKETTAAGSGLLSLAGAGAGTREAVGAGTSTLGLISAGASTAERSALGIATIGLHASGFTPADQRDITLAVTPLPSRYTATPLPSRWTIQGV